MNGVVFRMGMAFFTCAGLLTFFAGCPSQQYNPSSTATPGPVISKADLETIRYKFHRKLNPENSNVEGNKELVLIDFREEPTRLGDRLQEVKSELKHIVLSKRDARIFDERPGNGDFSFRYHYGKTHGQVICELRQHQDRGLRPGQQGPAMNHWDIFIHVKEEVRP